MGTERTVVITGGTAGVGRATVQEFARRGYRVAILARESQRLRQTVSEAKRLGSPMALGISTDVSNYSSIETAAARIENELGQITIWINNAMATIFSPVNKITPREYQRATEVTYLGSVYGTMVALKHMRPRNTGIIVQVGSALAYRAIPLQAPYCGAKFALRGFIDSLRTELLHDRADIHVTMVQLPAHNTPQFSWARTHGMQHPQPVPPIYQPEVAAQAIYWASQHRRREVWVGRPAITAIMVNKFFPSLADRYLARTGFSSQVMSRPLEKNWPGNLFRPVKGNFASHGIFDNRARGRSLQFVFERLFLFHDLADPVLAAFTSLGMIPGYVYKLATKRSKKETGTI